ncbi:hypothetical protein, partial [Massilia cavernae]|uniref:hypothetical protein n=1 Tax=Massilia cavernae TaxID=2320864 RepID=UPI001602DF56
MHNVISTNTKPAAAAFVWNASSGLEVQLNICMGITVNGDDNQSNIPADGSPLNGAGGRNAMKVSAPIVMMGA